MSRSRVVVFGATGNVGFGAATAFLDSGAQVLAPTRSEAGAERLNAAFSNPALQPVVGDISDPSGAEALRDEIAERGPIDHVVASLGPWWQKGPLAGQAPGEWQHVRRMLVDGHVHAAATLLPLLRERPGASYTVVTGMGAHHLVPDTSLLFVACGAVLSLAKWLRAEMSEGPVRVNELLIGCRIEKEPRKGVVPSAVFGRAPVAIAGSQVRGQVLRYDGPDEFALPT